MADPTYRQATSDDAVGIAAVGTAVWEELGAGSGLPGAPTAEGVVARMKELGMEHLYVEIAGGDHSRFINQSEEVVGMLFDFFNIVAKKH